MSCVLHISGDFTEKEFLDKIILKPYQVLEKGKKSELRKDLIYKNTSCSIAVSEKDFKDFEGQVQDAIVFLKANFNDLSKIHELKIEEFIIDFGIESRFVDEGVITHSNLIPARLMKLAGDLGIDILLSHYWIEKED